MTPLKKFYVVEAGEICRIVASDGMNIASVTYYLRGEREGRGGETG